MNTGTIARLNNGYGFITQEGSDKDLFFHVNELVGVAFDDLREGDKLQFEVGEGPKGPNAVKVSLLEEGAATPEAANDNAAPAADDEAAA
jgi:CspA family cold shock protein